MAATNIVNVTKTWTKLADGSCLVQARDSSIPYRICVQSAQPAQQADNFVSISLKDATVLDFSTPVWCRLPSSTDLTAAQMVVVA